MEIKEFISKLDSVWEQSRGLHNSAYELLSALGDMLSKRATTPCESDLVDCGYLLRQIERVLDEVRKDVKVRKELVGKLLCLLAIRDVARQANPTNADKVEGSLANGKLDMRMSAMLPKYGTPEFAVAMADLKVPEAAQLITRFDWKRVEDLVTELSKSGKPIPSWLTRVTPQYSVVYHKKGNANGEDGKTSDESGEDDGPDVPY